MPTEDELSTTKGRYNEQYRKSKWSLGKSTLLAIACALARASIGYDSQIDNVVPAQISTPLHLRKLEYSGGLNMYQIVSNAYTIGTLAGAVLTFFLGDFLGRKKNVSLGALVGGLDSIVQASSFGPPQFIAGRALAGIGCGLNTASAPVWQVEVSETRLRGRLVLVQLTARAAGGMIAGWISLAALYSTEGKSLTLRWWRVPVAVQLAFLLCLLIILPTVPESPRYRLLAIPFP